MHNNDYYIKSYRICLPECHLFQIESSTNHLLFTCVCKCRVGIEDCGIPDISNHLAARPTYYLFASLVSFYVFFCISVFLCFVLCTFNFFTCVFVYFLIHPTIWLPGTLYLCLPVILLSVFCVLFYVF